MSTEELIDLADRLIELVFEGVYDKCGVPYVEHPRRVAAKINDGNAKIVALLHDVIEDTEVTEEDLLEMGFPKEIVDAVTVITIKEGEEYNDYISRVISTKNKLSLLVKKADMEDNQDEKRLQMLEENERLRLINKYKDNYKRVVETLESM